MKYIDKSINKVSGTAIVNELLNDSWDENVYYGANYDGLKKPKYKQRFSELLLNEQENYCCYCMKQITDHSITLEHIIPQASSEDDFNKYMVVSELIDNVIYRSHFDWSKKHNPNDKHPHDIAYHNIIAACSSCNNNRGDNPIFPLIYDRDIANKIFYDRGGNISCTSYENDLVNIGFLLSKSPLNLIRLIWYKLSQAFECVEQIKAEAIDDIINDLIISYDDISIVDNFLGEPSYNSEVIKYHWFFMYYKNNNN